MVGGVSLCGVSSGGGQPAGVVGGEHVSHTSNKRLNAPCIRLRHHPHHSCLHDPLRPQDHPRTTPGPGTPNPSPPNPHPVRHDTQHHPHNRTCYPTTSHSSTHNTESLTMPGYTELTGHWCLSLTTCFSPQFPTAP
jgi:hypothetical protein